jgi:hypothetical protein
MYGAEFTKLYANRYGSKIRPAENARFVAVPQRPAPPARTPVRSPSAAADSGQIRRQIAIGLMGLALGLLLAFVTGWRRQA